MAELKRKATETPRLKDGAHTPFAEAYRELRTNLEYQADTQGVKSVLLAVPMKSLTIRSLQKILPAQWQSGTRIFCWWTAIFRIKN